MEPTLMDVLFLTPLIQLVRLPNSNNCTYVQ